jgi:hypothetical protein
MKKYKIISNKSNIINKIYILSYDKYNLELNINLIFIDWTRSCKYFQIKYKMKN